MDFSTAVILFLKQSVREYKIFFQPGNESRENIIALYEAGKGKNKKRIPLNQ